MRSWTRLIVALAGILAVPALGYAQETVLTGTIVDATDAVVPGVTVTALNVASGNTFVGVSDASGAYRIGALRPGVYRVTAELPGFNTVTRDSLELLLGQRAVMDMKMSLSTVQESVTVTGEAPLIDTTQSSLGGNIDSRQMEELPVNGRNWVDLALLAPGNRSNAVQFDSVVVTGGVYGGQQSQTNVDGQMVTNMITGSGILGEARYSRDTIAEFELVSNRFDATQGRSAGIQVNAITKSGTNRLSGSAASYFRSDKFNAEDPIVHRVLPYQNQQISTTLGGPIRRDRVHFFGNYEYEREPRTLTFTSPYPRFNNSVGPGLSGGNWVQTRTEKKYGGRVDTQFSQTMRLMVRANRYVQVEPQEARRTGGATRGPATTNSVDFDNNQVYGTLTQVFGSSAVNEFKAGYNGLVLDRQPPAGVETAPVISLRGYLMGKGFDMPQSPRQYNTVIGDNLTLAVTARGRHELKLGGEFMYSLTDFPHYDANRYGTIDATGGPVPANIEDLFPVWNDPSTWNIAALSPITRFYTQAFGTFSFEQVKWITAAWVQDNWAVSPNLTLNLGLRHDLSINSIGEDLIIPPFLPTTRPHELLNFQPRLGFAYTLGKTVLRGGFGKYFSEPNSLWSAYFSNGARAVTFINDGRPDFASNPFNGRPAPTFEEVLQAPQKTIGYAIVAPDFHSSYSWQSSIGFQRQIGASMSFEADYVNAAGRREAGEINGNLSFDPATGANYPFQDVSKRPYPDYVTVPMLKTNGWSDYNALQTAFTKRFNHRWQASATYTLSSFKNASPYNDGPCFVSGAIGPCPAGFKPAPDLGGEYTGAAADQRHRAVFNGIWQLPVGFQVSGVYFYGSGYRFATTWGTDLRNVGLAISPNRLRPNGTIVPRNNLVGDPIHRVDLRVTRQFPFGRVRIDGIAEVFNLFNHENYGSYVPNESNAAYGRPQQNIAVAYQPRMAQLGFRVSF